MSTKHVKHEVHSIPDVNGPDVKEVWQGLVFRPEVRMLNGTGPVTSPMRTLFVDGSPESRRAFEWCDEHAVDMSVQITDPGNPVVLHDRFLHVDFVGFERIKIGIELARKLEDETNALIAAAPILDSWKVSTEEYGVVDSTLKAEEQERRLLMEQAVQKFESSK